MFLFFFFNDTATTEIYTLSLHDALPISDRHDERVRRARAVVPQGSRQHPVRRLHERAVRLHGDAAAADRKSTRLNSSHGYISYAVFCLKKKKRTVKYYNAAYML